jgi:EAL domain-containing protein (putative c-di-GMP-specific phosphodiesterase class I)
VRSLVAFGHDCDSKVVAEGVETEQQRQTLLKFGCDRAQGFLFGRAVFPDAVPAVVNQRSR